MSVNKEKIVRILAEQYDLPKNQRDILNVLIHGDATAEAILSTTTVSSGRIYRVLKDMQRLGLIVKIEKEPAAVYSIDNLSGRINAYLEHSFNEFLNQQKVVKEALSELEGGTRTKIIQASKDLYDAEIMKLFSEGKYVKIIHKHQSFPWFLYIDDESRFFKIREYIKKSRIIGSSSERDDLLAKRNAYFEMYKSKRVEHIMSDIALAEYVDMLGKVFDKNEKSNIIDLLRSKLKESKNVKISFSDKLHMPSSIYLTDKQVLMPFFFSGDKHRLLVMEGHEIVDAYAEYFEEYTKASKNILEYPGFK